MDILFETLPAWLWGVSICIAALAGLVKGTVGFAMPLIMMSGISSFASPEIALAGLILPTLATNGVQAFRSGVGSAGDAIRRFRWFLAAGGVCILVGAQFVPIISETMLFLIIGIPIVVFALAQLSGWQPAHRAQSKRLDLSFGAAAGLIGGVSGSWGPPTVLYLTALNTPKTIQIQIQGVIYFLGAIVLTSAHVLAGILTAQTAIFSVCLVVPAMIGLLAGMHVHDRIDQKTFRRATLIVLLVAGANLVRRGVAF